MSELLDYPNLQVLGLDPPWVEGSGGAGGPAPRAAAAAEPELEELTKAQLLEKAGQAGAEADETMTKAQIRAAIEEAGG